ncbi:MAG: hypothetical protein R2873_18875 [Caldilineaceae bacterium]
MRTRHGAVGHVDGVGAHALGVASAFDLLLRVEAARRVHFDADHELAGIELLEQLCGFVGGVLVAFHAQADLR